MTRNPQVTTIRKQLRALRRRAAASAEQCRWHACLTDVYGQSATDDLAAIKTLEAELAAIVQTKVVN